MPKILSLVNLRSGGTEVVGVSFDLNTGIFQFSPTQPMTTVVDFDRVILCDSRTGVPTVIMDVIHDPSNDLNEFTVVGTGDEHDCIPPRISLQCAVPCRLNGGSQRVVFSALIAIARNPQGGVQLRYSSLRFGTESTSPDSRIELGQMLFDNFPPLLDVNAPTLGTAVSGGISPIENGLHAAGFSFQFAPENQIVIHVSHAPLLPRLEFHRRIDASSLFKLPLGMEVAAGSAVRPIVVVEHTIRKGQGSEPSLVEESIIELQIPDEVFRASWNASIAQRYLDSLNMVQAGRPLSCMPQFVAPGPSTWTLFVHAPSWEVRGMVPTGVSQKGLVSMPGFPLDEGTPLQWPLLVNPARVNDDKWLDRINTSAAEFHGPGLDPQKFGCIYFEASVPASNLPRQTSRLGSLDLVFSGKLELGDLVVPTSYSVNFQRRRLFLAFNMVFPLDDIQAGGQDDVPNFVPALPSSDGHPAVTQLNPVLIPRDAGTPQTQATAPFSLKIAETTSAQANQTLTLRLSGASSSNSQPRNLIVLDSQPFLIAQVSVPPFLSGDEQSNEIGHWATSEITGTAWQIHGGSDRFTVQLPPQAIGEPMIKGFNTPGLVGSGLGYTFSPAASFVLRPSYFKQNFTDPPWNLRRIFGYPGEQAPGAGVISLDFELLYGLSCTVDYPYLRLAEISARLGDVAAVQPSETPAGFSAGQITRYINARDGWIRSTNIYRSRLSVLEPWDDHQPDTLSLIEGVTYRLRQNARLQYPIPNAEPDNIAIPSNGLAGSYAWAFESKNVYEQLWKTPTSSSAKLSRPYYSTLGGWGYQKASFNNDLTTIYSDTAMGRTFFLSVERIGRIGVFWNHAKYVVIYERSVEASDQFTGEQDALTGTPALRKVSEYIEVLQPDRSYPEAGTAGAPIARGFVLGTHFKSIRMNVDSAWGGDVPDGWQIPLWNPAANAAKPLVYPMPHVVLEVGADPTGGAPSTFVDFAEPQKLVFFTQTSGNPDAHTDSWAAVQGIDYLNTPRASAPPGFRGRLDDMKADTETAPGYGRFTYTVQPGGRPVNLVQERTTTPVNAALRNVTMMRAAKGSTLAPGPNDKLDDRTVVHQATDAIQKLGDRIKTDVAGVVQQAKTWSDRIASLNPDTAQDQICSTIAMRAQSLVDLAQAGVTSVFLTNTRAFVDAIGPLTATLDNWTDAVKTNAQALVNQTFQQPLDLLGRAESGFSSANAGLTGLKQQFKDAIASEEKNLTDNLPPAGFGGKKKDALRAARTIHFQTLDHLAAFESNFVTPITSLWLGDRADTVTVALRNLRASVDSAFKKAEAGLIALADDADVAAAALQQIRTDIIKNVLDPVAQDGGKVLTALQQLVNSLGATDQSVKTKLAGIRDQILADITDATPPKDWPTHTRSKIQPLIADELKTEFANLRTQVGNWAKATCSAALPTSDIAAIAQNLAGMLDISSLPQLFADDTDALAARINQIGQEAAQSLSGYLARADQMLPQLDYQLPDSGLRLLRASGDPPKVPNLDFHSVGDAVADAVGYYFDEAKAAVDITPVVGRVFNGLPSIKPLGVRLPTTQILDRLLPPDLSQFDLSKILPSFAGLDLSNLFPDLKMPAMANDKVRITHGTDLQTLRAWLQADINMPISGTTTLLSFGPVTVNLSSANFTARVKIEAGVGSTTKQTFSGVISGAWEMLFGGTLIAVMVDTSLTFDQDGHLSFNIKPENVKIQGVLEFLADALSELASPGDGGLSIRFNPTPMSVQCILDLPLPDVEFGAFGLANLRLGAMFSVALDQQERFQLLFHIFLATKQAPFTLTIFILGGGGWFDAAFAVTPAAEHPLQAHISIGVTAGASLAISLGPISGGIYAYFGIEVEFDAGSSNSLTIGILLEFRGQVSLLGIVDVSIELMLEATYSQGRLTGRGSVDISIKICWCFTLHVSASVEYTFGQGTKTQSVASASADPFDTAAGNYVNSLE